MLHLVLGIFLMLLGIFPLVYGLGNFLETEETG